MSDEIRSKVEAIVESAQVKYTTRYLGEITRSDNWKCDEWRIYFSIQRHNPPYSGVCNLETKKQSFEFFTGLGLRHPVNALSSVIQAKLNPGCIAWHEIEKTRKPKAPHMADVLYSLILDSSVAEQTFADWCSEYGYDTDSRKALATYEACQQNTDKLRSIFSRDVIRQLSETLEGY